MAKKNYFYKYFALRPTKIPYNGKLVVFGRGEEIPADALSEKDFNRLSTPRVGYLQKVVVVTEKEAREIGQEITQKATPKYGTLDKEMAKAKEAQKVTMATIPAESEKVTIQAAGIEPEITAEPEPVEEKPKKKDKKKRSR